MSVQAFTFWSSGVLGLTTKSAAGETVTTPANDFTYVVEVHDSKAPATVQISVGFDFPETGCTFLATKAMPSTSLES